MFVDRLVQSLTRIYSSTADGLLNEIKINFILLAWPRRRTIFYFHVNSTLTLSKINAKAIVNVFVARHFALRGRQKPCQPTQFYDFICNLRRSRYCISKSVYHIDGQARRRRNGKIDNPSRCLSRALMPNGI